MQFEAVYYGLTGGVIVLFFLALTWRQFRVSVMIMEALADTISPNGLTVLRLPIALAGAWIYVGISHYYGFCFIVTSFAMDRLDGACARVTGWDWNWPLTWNTLWADFWYPGVTRIGKWLDPLVDKLSVLPLMYMFVMRDVLYIEYVHALAVLEAISMGVRLLPSFGKKGASWAGKTKMICEIVTLLSCIPVDLKWPNFPVWFPQAPDILVLISIFFAVLSIVSRYGEKNTS